MVNRMITFLTDRTFCPESPDSSLPPTLTMRTGWYSRLTLDRERAEQETRLREQETRLRDQQTRLRDQQTRLKDQETKLGTSR